MRQSKTKPFKYLFWWQHNSHINMIKVGITTLLKVNETFARRYGG